MKSFVLTEVPVELEPGAARALSGWVVARARLGPQGPGAVASLLLSRDGGNPGKSQRITLPLDLQGRIEELIWLPEDLCGLSWTLPADAQVVEPRLTIRRVGRVDRIMRMADRVSWIRRGLTEDQQRRAGLTPGRALRDLKGAFRAASGFNPHASSLRYQDWVESFDVLRAVDIARIRRHAARFASRPHFRLIVAAQAGGRDALRDTLVSLDAQIYGEFTCIVLEGAGAPDIPVRQDIGSKADQGRIKTVAGGDTGSWLAEFNRSLADARNGEWVMILRAGDRLPVHALYWFACEIQARPDRIAVYSDDDCIDAQGCRSDPRFKPDWSPTHLQSIHYQGAAVVMRANAVAKAGGLTPDCCRHGNYDLLLRMVDSCGQRIAHIPAVLYHRGSTPGGAGGWEDPCWCAGALRAHFARTNVAADVIAAAGHRRVRYRLPEAPPLVSIIVPTRDALALLRQCVASVLQKTAYPRYEVLVIDNRSVEAETLAYLAGLGERPEVRVLRYDGPFNFSAINNFAAREAGGELLCLLNNDTSVITADWLDEMVGHLLQRGVGAVGAKLYYPSGRVQHAGVAMGLGGPANHLHTGLARDAPGYCNRAQVAQECSAVTAACLLTWKNLYARLGGLSERWLPVTFNDIDYCLRLQDAGYRVVFTPYAELMHHESATRGRDIGFGKWLRLERELRYMRMRWARRMKRDPYYNLNLSYRRADFSFNERPNVPRPWSNIAR